MDRDTARAICGALIPGIEQISRQFEAALNECANVAARTGEDAEKVLQEARALAASTTMTVTDAAWYVAAKKQREYNKREWERLSAGG